jgi:hypothetical protein
MATANIVKFPKAKRNIQPLPIQNESEGVPYF